MTISFSSFSLLAIALSMDTFTAGFSYGAGKVKIPSLSLFIIAFISGLMFTLSLCAGSFLLPVLPASLTKTVSFLVLFFLALYKLYDSLPEKRTASRNFTTNAISRKVNGPDIHILSPKESILLSFALSIDSISAGFSAGLPPLRPIIIFLLVTMIHFMAILFGYLLGSHFSQKKSYNFTWLTALLLFLLACLRLF